MLRLFLIFIAFIINTTITYLWTIEGTWPNLLFKSLSLSMIIVLCSITFVLLLKIKKKTEEIKNKEYLFGLTYLIITLHFFYESDKSY